MKPEPVIVDTGAWLLALAGEEPYTGALTAARPAIIPGLVLAEVDWHLRADRPSMRRLMLDLARGAYAYEAATQADLSRAMDIDAKFANLGLGLVDASIAALAERLGIHLVLTIDSDFVALRVGKRWDRALRLVVPPPKRASKARRLRRRRR